MVGRDKTKQITLNKSSAWFSRAAGIVWVLEGNESHRLECLLTLTPALAGQGPDGGTRCVPASCARQRAPCNTAANPPGGRRVSAASLLADPHCLWPALNTADNTGFIAQGCWQTGANCQAAVRDRRPGLGCAPGHMVRMGTTTGWHSGTRPDCLGVSASERRQRRRWRQSDRPAGLDRTLCSLTGGGKSRFREPQ